ncbi:MAG: B12-binding domain-containing protein [Candidatus Limnocylindrales bacterium]
MVKSVAMNSTTRDSDPSVAGGAPNLPPVDATAARRPGEVLAPELLASLLADGDDELAVWALSQALSEASRASVYDGLLADAMRLVGERWASGRWTVAEEHLASQTLLRALDRLRPASGPESRIGPLAVLAGAQGEHHMIGLVCLDHVLREGGWTVANLGGDVPIADLSRFIERNDVGLLALSASDLARSSAILETIARARAAAGSRRGSNAPPLPVLLGGRLAEHPGVGARVGATWSGRSLAEAQAIARSLLGSIPAAVG